MHKVLKRVYKNAYEIWEQTHQDLKTLIKKYPETKNKFLEEQLDLAGTNAQVNLFKYDLLDLNGPKRALPINTKGRGISTSSTKNPERPSPSHITIPEEVF